MIQSLPARCEQSCRDKQESGPDGRFLLLAVALFGPPSDRGIHMKRIGLLVICLFLSTSVIAGAEDFLGAPVLPDGKTTTNQSDRLEKTYSVPYKQAVQYYEKALKEIGDVKFWDRGDETYIEDHSNRPWHSITIAKANSETTVTIVKDNWTWILGTLLLRFIAVFVVLLALYLAMSISGAVLARVARAQAAPAKK